MYWVVSFKIVSYSIVSICVISLVKSKMSLLRSRTCQSIDHRCVQSNFVHSCSIVNFLVDLLGNECVSFGSLQCPLSCRKAVLVIRTRNRVLVHEFASPLVINLPEHRGVCICPTCPRSLETKFRSAFEATNIFTFFSCSACIVFHSE